MRLYHSPRSDQISYNYLYKATVNDNLKLEIKYIRYKLVITKIRISF